MYPPPAPPGINLGFGIEEPPQGENKVDRGFPLWCCSSMRFPHHRVHAQAHRSSADGQLLHPSGPFPGHPRPPPANPHCVNQRLSLPGLTGRHMCLLISHLTPSDSGNHGIIDVDCLPGLPVYMTSKFHCSNTA